MKRKTIAALLAAIMLTALASCSGSAKPEFVEINANKVASITLTESPDADADARAFVEAYNTSEVAKKADENDKKGAKAIVMPYTNGEDIFTLLYLGDNKFCVTGTLVETEYIIESAELAELYNETIDPTPEFVSIDADKAESISFVKNIEAKADTADFVEAYNASEFKGSAKDAENTSDVIVISCGEDVFTLYWLGEDEFKVSGTLIDANYIIVSEKLAELYNEAVAE